MPGDRRSVVQSLTLLLLWSISSAIPAAAGGPFLTIEYPLPPGITNPSAIAAGPDGNLWFIAGATLGRITPQGNAAAVAPIPGAIDLAAGADGNLWVTICNGGSGGAHEIVRATLAGNVTHFA